MFWPKPHSMLTKLAFSWQKSTRKDKLYLLAIVLVTVVAFFFRSYNLKNSQQFLGDQGRDALIVARIFKDHNLVFIGPVTSVGNMYLGPLYYYWMLPWLMLTYPSPMGPIYAMVVLGILTVSLTYFLGQELIGRRGALIASAILALMPVAINLSRFSWNPNPAPLISLLMIWATWRAYHQAKKYWLLVALSFAILIQLHYVTLLTLPAAGLIWLVQLVKIWRLPPSAKREKDLKQLIKYTLFSCLLILFSFLPLFLFDLKHHWLNSRAFIRILTQKGFTTKNTSGLARLVRAAKETQGRSLQILFEITLGKTRWLNQFLLASTGLYLIYLIKFKRLLKKYPAFSIILIYLLVGIAGLSFYTSTVFDHYIAYLYPVTALTIGLVLSELMAWKKMLGWLLTLFFLVGESLFLSRHLPYRSAGLTLDEIAQTAKLIQANVPKNEKYNLVLLDEAKDLYGMKYRYYLDAFNQPVLPPGKADEAQRLVIVDERLKRRIKPFALHIYELEIFPNKTGGKHLIGPDGQDIWVLKR